MNAFCVKDKQDFRYDSFIYIFFFLSSEYMTAIFIENVQFANKLLFAHTHTHISRDLLLGWKLALKNLD